jgi:muramoyltetrapeptide carboxypeptidase
VKIGIVAPACPLDSVVPGQIRSLAALHFGNDAPELLFHPQCFLSGGHFAGPDQARADAFVELANDPTVDALWFARGGYGSNRILPLALPRLTAAAKAKTYLGYSDMGFLLGALYAAGIGTIAHGPMVNDIKRTGGDAAVLRALDWLVHRNAAALEPNSTGQRCSAFNITVLSHLIGTPWIPNLSDHILMLEDIDEHLYAIDRNLFHITSHPDLRTVAGIRLGRCGEIPANDRPFGMDEEAIARHWCAVSGIPYLGRADIGHDADNKIVSFG